MRESVKILPIHQRLAELYVLNKQGVLSPEQMQEVQWCLAENAKYCYEMAFLENKSLLASMTSDMDWQHEICLEIDKLEAKQDRRKKRK